MKLEIKKENFHLIVGNPVPTKYFFDKICEDYGVTPFEAIQTIREDGYPKIKEIKPTHKFKTERKDPNYDLPYNNLTKIYHD